MSVQPDIERFATMIGALRKLDARGVRGPKKSGRSTLIVRHFLANGGTLQETGKAFGITRERVRQVLNEAGISHRRGNVGLPREEHERRLAAYNEGIARGLSGAEAAKLAGVSQPMVYVSARAVGIAVASTRQAQVNRLLEIAAYWQAHDDMTGRQVAAHFGVRPTAVSKALLRAGLRQKQRPRSRKGAAA